MSVSDPLQTLIISKDSKNDMEGKEQQDNGTHTAHPASPTGEHQDAPSDDNEEDDPIVRTIQVYVNRIAPEGSGLSGGGKSAPEDPFSVYMLQYPLRPAYRPYGDHGRLVAVRHRSQQHTLQMEYELNVESDNFDSSHLDDEGAENGVPNPVTHILNSVQCESEHSSYGLGLLRGNRLYITPLNSILQFRPDLSRLDVEAEASRRKAEETTRLAAKARAVAESARVGSDANGTTAGASKDSPAEATAANDTSVAHLADRLGAPMGEHLQIPPRSEWHRYPAGKIRDMLLAEPWRTIDAFYDPDSPEAFEVMELLSSFAVKVSNPSRSNVSGTDPSLAPTTQCSGALDDTDPALTLFSSTGDASSPQDRDKEGSETVLTRVRRVPGGPLVPKIRFSPNMGAYLNRLCSLKVGDEEKTLDASTSGPLSYLQLSRLPVDQQILRILQHRHVLSTSEIQRLLTQRIPEDQLVLRLRAYADMILGNWVCKSQIVYDDNLVAHCRDLLLFLLSSGKAIVRDTVRPYMGQLSVETLTQLLKEVAEYRTNAWHFKLPTDVAMIRKYPGVAKESMTKFGKDSMRSVVEKIISLSKAHAPVPAASTGDTPRTTNAASSTPASNSQNALGLIHPEKLNKAITEVFKAQGALKPKALLPAVQLLLRQDVATLQPAAQQAHLNGTNGLTEQDLCVILPRLAEDLGCGYWALRKTGNVQHDRHRDVIMSIFKKQALTPNDPEILKGISRIAIQQEFEARKVTFNIPDFVFRKFMKYVVSSFHMPYISLASPLTLPVAPSVTPLRFLENSLSIEMDFGFSKVFWMPGNRTLKYKLKLHNYVVKRASFISILPKPNLSNHKPSNLTWSDITTTSHVALFQYSLIYITTPERLMDNFTGEAFKGLYYPLTHLGRSLRFAEDIILLLGEVASDVQNQRTAKKPFITLSRPGTFGIFAQTFRRLQFSHILCLGDREDETDTFDILSGTILDLFCGETALLPPHFHRYLQLLLEVGDVLYAGERQPQGAPDSTTTKISAPQQPSSVAPDASPTACPSPRLYETSPSLVIVRCLLIYLLYSLSECQYTKSHLPGVPPSTSQSRRPFCVSLNCLKLVLHTVREASTLKFFPELKTIVNRLVFQPGTRNCRICLMTGPQSHYIDRYGHPVKPAALDDSQPGKPLQKNNSAVSHSPVIQVPRLLPLREKILNLQKTLNDIQHLASIIRSLPASADRNALAKLSPLALNPTACNPILLALLSQLQIVESSHTKLLQHALTSSELEIPSGGRLKIAYFQTTIRLSSSTAIRLSLLVTTEFERAHPRQLPSLSQMTPFTPLTHSSMRHCTRNSLNLVKPTRRNPAGLSSHSAAVHPIKYCKRRRRRPIIQPEGPVFPQQEPPCSGNDRSPHSTTSIAPLEATLQPSHTLSPTYPLETQDQDESLSLLENELLQGSPSDNSPFASTPLKHVVGPSSPDSPETSFTTSPTSYNPATPTPLEDKQPQTATYHGKSQSAHTAPLLSLKQPQLSPPTPVDSANARAQRTPTTSAKDLFSVSALVSSQSPRSKEHHSNLDHQVPEMSPIKKTPPRPIRSTMTDSEILHELESLLRPQ